MKPNNDAEYTLSMILGTRVWILKAQYALSWGPRQARLARHPKWLLEPTAIA